MTLEEAIAIITDRDGKPYEDDWDLAEASNILLRDYRMLVEKSRYDIIPRI